VIYPSYGEQYYVHMTYLEPMKILKIGSTYHCKYYWGLCYHLS